MKLFTDVIGGDTYVSVAPPTDGGESLYWPVTVADTQADLVVREVFESPYGWSGWRVLDNAVAHWRGTR